MTNRCIVKPGTYSTNDPLELGVLWRFTPTGTAWKVVVVGTDADVQKFYLNCTGVDGKAVAEIIGGIPYNANLNAPVKVECQDGSMWANRNIGAGPTTPLVEYLYDSGSDVIFKVKNVISDNLIELYSDCGLADGADVTLIAYMCKGVSISQIDITVDTGGTVSILRPGVSVQDLIRTPGVYSLKWNNLDGPFRAAGSNCTIDIHFEPAEQRLS